jgi:hypothetical protein
MVVFLEVDAGEHTTFDTTGQLRYKRPPRKESAMNIQILAVAIVLAVGSIAHAENFQIEPVIYRGDPKGSREAGTRNIVAAPEIVTKSGETGSVHVGGVVAVNTPNGKKLLMVGQLLHVTATAVDGGGIKVEATFEHIELIGKGPEVTNLKEKTAATVQPGGKIRVELGDDPKDRHWVDITVRMAKR